MAKKKAKAPKPVEVAAKKNLLVIRGYPSWLDWVNAYAKFKRVPAVALIDALLSESARRDGFKEPPERF